MILFLMALLLPELANDLTKRLEASRAFHAVSEMNFTKFLIALRGSRSVIVLPMDPHGISADIADYAVYRYIIMRYKAAAAGRGF